jgi:hypothetical protein
MTIQPNPPARPARADPLTRFFGGPPLAVVFKLILLSVLVGLVLTVLGLDPFNIIRSIEELVRWIWDMGFDVFVRLWRYFLLGAVLVIPIWLFIRLARVPRGR